MLRVLKDHFETMISSPNLKGSLTSITIIVWSQIFHLLYSMLCNISCIFIDYAFILIVCTYKNNTFSFKTMVVILYVLVTLHKKERDTNVTMSNYFFQRFKYNLIKI